MWVKICGITTLKDAEQVYKHHANAIGFIFTKSSRRIQISEAEKISAAFPQIQKVGVFVNEDVNRIKYIRKKCSLDIIQLHGDESPVYCKTLGGKIIKAFSLKSQDNLSLLNDYSMVWKKLLDSYSPDVRGGSGKQINQSVLENIVFWDDIILAGGLNPFNISKILKSYHPFGIDVSSGVETSPGRKDVKKLSDFMSQIID